MSDRLSFSLDNFKTTSESSDFSASLLSSLDLDFDKFDLTLKNDDTTLTNSPVLPTEKKTSPIHKPSLQRKPVHRSSLLSEPEITSADLTSSPALHNADAILQHFESFASSPRSRLSSPPLDLKLDAPQSPTILPPRSNSVSLGNEHISKPEMSKMLSTGDFEKMLTTAGTKHLSSTPDIMNSLDIPPDQFEFSMPSRRSSLIDGVKAQGFKIFGKLGAKKPRPSSGLVVSNTSFSLDSSNAPPALPPRNSKSKLSEQTNSEEDLARPSSPFIRPSSPVNQPNSPIPRSDPIQRAKSPFSFVEGSDHLEKLAAELMPPEVAQVNSILPAEISRPVSPGLESARPSSILSSKLSVSSGKPESTTVKSPNGEKTVQTMLEFLLTESEGPTSPRSPMSPSLPRKTDSATPVNPLARLIPEPNIIAKQLPGAEGWHDMVPDLNPKPKMESIEIQTDEFECEKCNEPKPTFEEKGTETDLVLEEAEKASVLEEENVRLRQELQAMKLMVQTARSQTQQMKILKEAAEARFEQLARVAHRKLVRAMVDRTN
ncbi:hypothetical protein HDV04_003679 [Boothiomyces sp. JEL0838]|nr:hypothetical protein HDV04_003679 [Boothiomyces sp. JEL0838]